MIEAYLMAAVLMPLAIVSADAVESCPIELATEVTIRHFKGMVMDCFYKKVCRFWILYLKNTRKPTELAGVSCF